MEHEKTSPDYKIIKANDGSAIVIGTCYRNPLSNIGFIQYDLNKMGYTGNVIIDTLMSNGYAMNRFIQMRCNNGELKYLDAKIIPEVDIPMDKIALIYATIQDNPEWIEASSLLKYQKARLNKSFKNTVTSVC